jgi:ferric-dicitrate binding protein FerR (iron transport regulator)
VQLHATYCAGDTLRVQDSSRADVALANQSVLRLSANTTLTLEGVQEERTSLVGLLTGVVHFFSRGPRSLEVRTPFTVAGVRGTEFVVSVEADKTFLSIFEGTVLATNEAGSLTLTGGQSAIAEAGQAPVLRLVARPRDAVRWALYYPPLHRVFPPRRDPEGL